MTKLKSLVSQQNVKLALIIDDVFDEVPVSEEVGNWNHFWDDLTDADEEQLTEFYPSFAATDDREYFQRDEAFISSLWNNREQLRPELSNHLFEVYISNQGDQRRSFETLFRVLADLGIQYITQGRQSEQADPDIIFIDLFLEHLGFEDSYDRAKQRLAEIGRLTSDRPPLVVLMSASPQLRSRRHDFRDESLVLGSMFRAISKSELRDENSVLSVLNRLLSNYENALLLNNFFEKWRTGAQSAAERFLKKLRRLDLSDLGQISRMSLDQEKQKLGDYLMDLTERSLAFEIEQDQGTLAAAKSLNAVDLDRNLSPHLANLELTQDFVQSMIYHHPRRCELSPPVEGLQLGDLFQQKLSGEDFGNHIFLLLTPACDLMRDVIDPLFVLQGTIQSFSRKSWSENIRAPHTPIYVDSFCKKYWIKWDFKKRQTIPLAELTDPARYQRAGRMREPYALDLQQRLLSSMGRIGLPSKPPANFPLTVRFYYLVEGDLLAGCF